MSSSKLPSGGYDLMNASEHYALYYGGFYNNNIAKGMSSEEASAAANKSTQSMYGRNPYNAVSYTHLLKYPTLCYRWSCY